MALDFVAGCFGGCAGVLVGHPFDTVKVHLQTQCHQNPQYRGTIDCLRKIIAKDSARGLYRGMSSPIGGVAFVNAIVFGVYGNVQRNKSNPDSLYSHLIAGGTAGLAQSVICSPMELAKTRLQLQSSTAAVKMKGPLDCLTRIWHKQGIRGVYKGLTITAARDVPGFCSYFVSYELMMRSTRRPNDFHTLMAGGLAGTFSWLCTFPIDIVKSRLQADGMASKPQYHGIVDCVRKSVAAEGVGFFARGLTSTLARAFPMNAACFLVVSWTLKLSGQSNINVSLQQPEPIAVAATIAGSAPVVLPFRPFDQVRHKSMSIRSLVALGAFSEAVCSTELEQLAIDLYDDRNGYHKMNEDTTAIPVQPLYSEPSSIVFID